MKIYQKIGAILALGLSGAANSAVLFDSLSSPLSGTQGIPPGWIGTAFSTGSNCPNGCALGDISLMLSGNIDGSIQGIVLQLFNDAGSVPGITPITHAYINPVTVSSTPDVNVFTSNPLDSAVVLNDNTEYWVRLDATAPGAANVDWGYVASGPGKWAFDTLLGQNSKGNGNSGPFMVRVEANPIGEVSNVPVPGAIWLMGSGVIGLISSWCRKKAS